MMMAVDAPDLSLLSLEDDLSCSICLSPFECPVTIPCGHNFCQDCLLATWKDSSYSCPQCRTVFATRPELKKNTVLSAVVETFKARSGNPEAGAGGEEVPQEDVIRCDACMEAQAAQTCLTCMASFCEEHLRPHRDNPVFRLHQLSEPVGDLMELMCPEHHKLMELFCSQHERSICSLCLHQEHKGCSFTSQEEQRARKESDLRDKLVLLDEKIQKTDTVVLQIANMHSQLKDAAGNKKAALATVYQQIRDLLGREEREAQHEVDKELEKSETKLQDLTKNLTKNSEKMRKSREALNNLLSHSQTPKFLQTSFELPKVSKSDPHVPQIHLDSAKVKATQTFAATLRDDLTEILKQPVEARKSLSKSDEKAPQPESSSSPSPKSQPKSAKPAETKQKTRNRSKSPGRPLIQPFLQPYPGPLPMWHPHQYPPGPRPGPNMGYFFPRPRPGEEADAASQRTAREWAQYQQRFPVPHSQEPPPAAGQMKKKPAKSSGEQAAKSSQDVSDGQNKYKNYPPAAEHTKRAEAAGAPLDITSAEKRNELLSYAAQLTLNPRTAHKRVVLSEGFTKATMSDEPSKYPDCPERFAVCSQVLASKGFSQGRHYWEVQLSGHNFVGIGLTYGSIDRKGPASRLGRNGQSWCVEWFNATLSAWHNSCETVLATSNPKRVGVLLDCDDGTATFFVVADRAYPFHTFVFPFTEPVYPAFWIFSKNISISLCKMQA